MPIKRRVLARIPFGIALGAPQGVAGHRHTYPAFRFLSFALSFLYPPFKEIFPAGSFASRGLTDASPAIEPTDDVSYVVQGIPYSYPE